MWYPLSSTCIIDPCTSFRFQQIIPSPATLLDEERSLIFMLLLSYNIKSPLCREMQTEAPESITTLKFIALLERHCVFSQVEIMERGTDTTPRILSLWSENNLSNSIIWLGSCTEMKSSKRVWDIWSAIFGAGSGIDAHPSKIGCPFLLCWTCRPLHGCFSCCLWWVRWRWRYLSCFFLALNKRSRAWLDCRRCSWIVIHSWLEEIGSKRQNGKPSSTTIAKRICHCKNLGRRGQFQTTVMKDWIWQRISSCGHQLTHSLFF